MISMKTSALIAKTSIHKDQYLPLWLHLKDTEAVMVHLVTGWLPEAALKIMSGNLENELFLKVCRFLALVHDLGKATPVFQDKVASLVEGGRNRLIEAGLTWKYVNSVFSPHALAGEELLLDAGCTPSVAAVVGAHHGKPTTVHERVDTDQLDCFDGNYYGNNRKAWKQAQ